MDLRTSRLKVLDELKKADQSEHLEMNEKLKHEKLN